jgi:protein-L-isoaspartate(D-aspartate) O-methyltransferase
MDWLSQRRLMVSHQLRARGIRDDRVLRAMLDIPREQFVPRDHRAAAYSDEPLGIGHGQTISQPYMTALMAQSLELEGTETVLEVGAGSGYHAAVLGALAAHVIAIELIPELAATARENLANAGRLANIVVITGDGSLGYPPEAPYDAISVAAGAADIPRALIEQLKDSGRLVIPVGPSADQELRLVRKQGGAIDWHVVTNCRFVPLRQAG